MIVRPAGNAHVAPKPNGFIPVWQAVEKTQKLRAERYWLITQPDHATLSGRLAASFAPEQFPDLSPEVVHCIGLHDAGWEPFDGVLPSPQTPSLGADGKPLTFTEMKPKTFLTAWSGSVARAVALTPLGGAMVSQHFCWLAKHRLRNPEDSPEDVQHIQQFVETEKHRQRSLAEQGATHEPVSRLLEILQFCDLLSLYICCGATDDVEFPQDFGRGPVRLRRSSGSAVLEPSPLAASAGFEVAGFVFPGPSTPPDVVTVNCELR
ncbi:MAG TPA: DUF3891 family protein [Clostridia bacterium]|nr:DUF3891 family protein [Clostridia bacterium]